MNTGKMYLKTSLNNGGRRAGDGILYDDYSESSYGPKYCEYTRVRLPNDNIKPEELNGPVICYKEERK